MNVDLRECGYCIHPQKVTLPGGSLRPVKYPSSVAVIEHPVHGVILFDTGYTNEFIEATKYFPERIYALVTPVHIDDSETAKAQLIAKGIQPSDVRYVVISHFHGDHVAGLKDFPQAKYIFMEKGWKAVQGFGRFEAVGRGVLKALIPNDFMERAIPLTEPTVRIASNANEAAIVSIFGGFFDLFKDGSILAVELPGHFPGHMGIIVNQAANPIFFIGDAAWHIENLLSNRRTPALTLKLLRSTPDYHASLDRVTELQKQCPPMSIVPCHCSRSIANFRQQLVTTV